MFKFDWEKLDQSVANETKRMINAMITQNLIGDNKPEFLEHFEVTGLSFGSIAPVIEIKDITYPPNPLYTLKKRKRDFTDLVDTDTFSTIGSETSSLPEENTGQFSTPSQPAGFFSDTTSSSVASFLHLTAMESLRNQQKTSSASLSSSTQGTHNKNKPSTQSFFAGPNIPMNNRTANFHYNRTKLRNRNESESDDDDDEDDGSVDLDSNIHFDEDDSDGYNINDEYKPSQNVHRMSFGGDRSEQLRGRTIAGGSMGSVRRRRTTTMHSQHDSHINDIGEGLGSFHGDPIDYASNIDEFDSRTNNNTDFDTITNIPEEIDNNNNVNSSIADAFEFIDDVVGEGIMLKLYLSYDGNARVDVSVEVAVNEPVPKFITLPISASVSNLVFEGTLCVIYQKDTVKLYFEDDDQSIPAPLKDIRVQLEIGDPEQHVLKEKDKIETFLLEQIQALLTEYLVYPNMWVKTELSETISSVVNSQ